MTANPSKYWRSLRVRIMLSVFIMLLPAAILLFSAYNTIRSNTEILTEIVQTPLASLLNSQAIQNKILKVERPFYLYLNRGDSADRETFVSLSVDIDLLFENISKQKNISPLNREALSLAQNEWREAKLLGGGLLTTSNILTEIALTKKIDQFSRHLKKSSSLLDEIRVNVQKAINHQHFMVQENEWRSIGILSLIFGLAVLLAILTTFSLSQSVTEPVRRLKKAVHKLSQGKYGLRINPKSNDELGSLAAEFNALAEYVEHIKNELDYLSVHDNLTGLLDSVKLHEKITSEIARAKRYNRPFSLLMIDVDNFKQVNKEYGRLIGDSVLCSVANKICSTVRPTDTSSRYGGDVFAIILSETDSKGAVETVQRLHHAIEKIPLNIGDGKQLMISITIAFASFPNDADSEIGLLAHAEQSLQDVKSKLKKTGTSASGVNIINLSRQ